LNGDGNSSYHGFQLKLEKRYSHGLNFIVAYAAQKTLASQDLGGYTANSVYPSTGSGRIGQVRGGLRVGRGAQDPRHRHAHQVRDSRHADRALSPDDIPQVFNFAGTYELPFGPGRWLGGQAKSWTSRLLGGWKLSTNFNAQKGVPLQISGPCNYLQSTIRSQS